MQTNQERLKVALYVRVSSEEQKRSQLRRMLLPKLHLRIPLALPPHWPPPPQYLQSQR